MVAEAYDLCIIGAGSGGVRAARLAGQAGARVVVVESGPLGGTCVNLGCIPKKLLSYAAKFPADFADARGYGWEVSQGPHHWPTLCARIAAELKRLNGIYDSLLQKAGVEVRRGHATVVGANTVAVAGGDAISCRHILIATGAAPFIPAVPGRQFVVSSNAMFSLPRFPRQLVIVGGGYIALEFASIMAGLGSQVTMVMRRKRVLHSFDAGMAEFLQGELAKKGVQFAVEQEVVAVSKASSANEKLTVTLKDGSLLPADSVLYATGRHPLTKGLGLEALGLELGKKGRIPVNAAFQSALPTLSAIGDVIGTPALTPIALAQAARVVQRLFPPSGVEGKAKAKAVLPPLNYELVPTAVFTHPELASVGLGEEQARQRYERVDIYESNFRPLKHSLTDQEERCYMKLVVERDSGMVAGVHMVGADAAEIMQGFAVAVQAGATKECFDATIGIHPSSGEEFVTMREPVRRWG